MSARSPLVATLLLILTLIASGLGTRSAYGSPPGPIDSSDRPATRSLTQRWIVRLAESPLAQAPGASPEFAVSALRAPTTGRLRAGLTPDLRRAEAAGAGEIPALQHCLGYQGVED